MISGAPIASKKRSVEELNGDITSSFDNTATKQSTCGDQMDVDDKESNPGNENGNENDALTDNRSKNS